MLRKFILTLVTVLGAIWALLLLDVVVRECVYMPRYHTDYWTLEHRVARAAATSMLLPVLVIAFHRWLRGRRNLVTEFGVVGCVRVLCVCYAAIYVSASLWFRWWCADSHHIATFLYANTHFASETGRAGVVLGYIVGEYVVHRYLPRLIDEATRAGLPPRQLELNRA